MAGKASTFENDLLKHIFQNAAIALIGDASGLQPSASAGNLFVSLHTADPGPGGDQTTSEISYTGYSRIGVVRSAGGWTVTSNSVSPAATIAFPASSGGTGGTVTFFAVGTATSGVGKLLYTGTVTPNITVANGVTPQLTTASTVTEA